MRANDVLGALTAHALALAQYGRDVDGSWSQVEAMLHKDLRGSWSVRTAVRDACTPPPYALGESVVPVRRRNVLLWPSRMGTAADLLCIVH
jgi:hypothetical protein